MKSVGVNDSLKKAREEETTRYGLYAIYGPVILVHFYICLYMSLMGSPFGLKIPIKVVSADLTNVPAATAFYAILICGPIYILGLSALIGILKQRRSLPRLERMPSLLGFFYKYRPELPPFNFLLPAMSFMLITFLPLVGHINFLTNVVDRSQVCESYYRDTCKAQYDARAFPRKGSIDANSWALKHSRFCASNWNANSKVMKCDVFEVGQNGKNCAKNCSIRFSVDESTETQFWPSLWWMLTYTGASSPSGRERIEKKINRTFDLPTPAKTEFVLGKKIDFVPIFVPLIVIVFEVIIILLMILVFKHWLLTVKYYPKPSRFMYY